MKHLLWGTCLLLAASAAWAGNSQLDADRDAVRQACYNELAAAKCERAAKPQNCLNRYQHAHSNLRISDGCAAARRKMNEASPELRDER